MDNNYMMITPRNRNDEYIIVRFENGEEWKKLKAYFLENVKKLKNSGLYRMMPLMTKDLHIIQNREIVARRTDKQISELCNALCPLTVDEYINQEFYTPKY